MDWADSEWASEAAAAVSLLPEVPGMSGTVSFAVAEGTGRKRSEAGFHWRYERGKAVEGEPGVNADADLVLLIAGSDADDLLSGNVEPSVSFMRGRLKASGDGAILLGFLRSTAQPEFETWRRKVAARL